MWQQQNLCINHRRKTGLCNILLVAKSFGNKNNRFFFFNKFIPIMKSIFFNGFYMTLRFVLWGPLATIFGVVILGHKVSNSESLAILLCFLGVMCITKPYIIFQYLLPEDQLENSNVKDNIGYVYISIGEWEIVFFWLYVR